MITRYKGEKDTSHLNDAMAWGQEQVFAAFSDTIEFWLAGGAPLHYFLNKDPNDFDLWFPNEATFNIVRERFYQLGFSRKIEDNYHLIVENSQGYEFDLIKARYFSSADEVLEGFDFTVACCALGREQITYHENYFEHIQTRALVFSNLYQPTSALRRMPKYLAKGFNISDLELESLATSISYIDMDDINCNIWEQRRQKANQKPFGATTNPTTAPYIPVLLPIAMNKKVKSFKSLKELSNRIGFNANDANIPF